MILHQLYQNLIIKTHTKEPYQHSTTNLKGVTGPKVYFVRLPWILISIDTKNTFFSGGPADPCTGLD